MIIYRILTAVVMIFVFFQSRPTIALIISSPSACYGRVDVAGLKSAIVVDNTDTVHMVFFEDKYVKHATLISGEWKTEIIRSVPGVYTYLSMAIDKSDNIHVSFYDTVNDILVYAVNIGGEWTFENLIEGQNSGENSSLAVGPTGKVYICYTDNINESLCCITNASGSWVSEMLENGSDTGLDADIAVDDNSKIHISYCDRSYSGQRGLVYITNSTRSWVKQQLYLGECFTTSIAIDNADKIHIGYQKTETTCNTFDCWTRESFCHTTNKSGVWINETVSDNYGSSPRLSSMAIDDNDNIHIIYTKYDVVSYSTNISGEWLTAVADDSGIACSDLNLAVDSSGNVHIAYVDYSYPAVTPYILENDLEPVAKYLKLATEVSISEISAEPRFSCYEYFSVTGKNIVSYKYQLDNGEYSDEKSLWRQIKVDELQKGNHTLSVICKNTAGSWQATENSTRVSWTTDNSFFEFDTLAQLGYAGGYSVLTHDKGGNVHVCCYDGILKYMTNRSGEWTENEIDRNAVSPEHFAIAADDNGNAYIAYIAEGYLKMASNVSGVWATEIIAACESYVSIGIDSSGGVHICYYADEQLYYTKKKSADWETIVLHSGGVSGKYNSIVLDAQDNVHVCYLSREYESKLMYATNRTGAWITEKIIGSYKDDDIFIGSIDIDQHGKAHVAFYDDVAQKTKYANNTTGQWIIETIGNLYWASRRPFIRVDESQNIHICLYNDDCIKYLTKIEGAWRIEKIDHDLNLQERHSFSIDDQGRMHVLYQIKLIKYLKYVCGFPPEADTDMDGIQNYKDEYPLVGALGDVNMNGKIDLADAVLALQITTGRSNLPDIDLKADVNKDDTIGLPEVLYILQKQAGL